MKPQSIAVLIGAIVVFGLAGVVTHTTITIGQDRLIKDVEPLIEYWLIFSSVFLFVLGSVGIAGAVTDNKCVLSFFAFGNLFVLLASLVAGSLIIRETVFMSNSVNDWCSVKAVTRPDEITDTLTMRLQRCYVKMNESLKNCRTQEHNSELLLDQCPLDAAKDDAGQSYTERRLWKVFRNLQRRFDCAGFCKGDIPLFSLKEQGGKYPTDLVTPMPACYPIFDKQFFDAGEAVGWVFLVACPILLISLVAAWWIVCAPPPRRIKGLLYDAHEEIELEEQ
eukprot:GDKI01032523.1.p1 GENE.GDKI01032523.1~~GDKI01032523.1.p1  ORF type:complete len:306 (+),score=105.64 GDKI01032523.1:83-919(+)